MQRLGTLRSGSGARSSTGARKADRKPRDMRCRYLGCKNTSKGPRFRFFCEEHLKLPKRKQDEALEKWNAGRA
jgi:hypothetical protein